MSEPYDIDWADIVDLFASEYGWSIEYIMSLDFKQIIILKEKIYERHMAQNGESVGQNIPSNIEDSKDLKCFEKIGGKRKVREDGTVEIVL